MSGAKPHRAHRKHGGAHDEEHENHERWLVTYADLLTLLMVLFIVMFAISAVDQKKFAELRDGLAKGFGAPSVAFTASGPSIQDADNTDSVFDIASGTGGTAQDAATQKAVKDAVTNADRARQQRQQEAAQHEVQNFEEIKKKIKEEMRKQGLQDSVRFNIDERGLVITIITSAVVFAGDRADLLPAGQQILNGIGPSIAGLPNRLEVDGHTNQLPVQTVNYPSGWELSTARASMVVRYLVGHAGVAENRLSAAGFADTRPLYPPSDPRAPTLNRRVEIVVLSTLSPAERALLPSAAAGVNSN
jgi:chemotaxis protein MotB